MTVDERITILDLLAERDRTTAAKLDAIASQLRMASEDNADLRAELRELRTSLLGVATGAEIASVKRQVNAELDAIAGRLTLAERRLDTREALEADAERRHARRAWMLPSSAQIPIGLLLLMAGALVERLVS